MKRMFLSLALCVASFNAWAAGDAKFVPGPAPSFTALGSDGKQYSTESLKGKYVVLEWWNKDCPFVKRHYSSGNMQKLQADMTKQGVQWLTVLSSAPEKQGYLPADKANEEMKKVNGSPTAILLDPEGKLGRIFEAKTTPHMYIIDPEGKLIYRGAIDDDKSGEKKTAKNYVRLAMEGAKTGDYLSPTTPYGCSVKYK
jgi:peroxiredoxin